MLLERVRVELAARPGRVAQLRPCNDGAGAGPVTLSSVPRAVEVDGVVVATPRTIQVRPGV